MVLYRAGGEQRSRTYIKNVKNPKSLAQMEQRIKMASLNGFFKALKSVLRFSFPQRPTNQSGFNAFMAASLPVATTALATEAADKGLSVPLDYAISKGDIILPVGSFAVPTFTDGATNTLVGGIQLIPIGSGVQNEIEDVLPAANGTTIAQAMQSAFDVHPELDAQLPNKFNLVVVGASYADDGFRPYYSIYKFERTNDGLVVETPPVSQMQWPNGIFPLWIGTTAIGKALVLAGVQQDEDNGASMVGAFFSYTDADGKLHVSSARMMVANDGGGYVEQFQKGGVAYDSYLEGLGYTSGDLLGTR